VRHPSEKELERNSRSKGRRLDKELDLAAGPTPCLHSVTDAVTGGVPVSRGLSRSGVTRSRRDTPLIGCHMERTPARPGMLHDFVSPAGFMCGVRQKSFSSSMKRFAAMRSVFAR